MNMGTFCVQYAQILFIFIDLFTDCTYCDKRYKPDVWANVFVRS